MLPSLGLFTKSIAGGRESGRGQSFTAKDAEDAKENEKLYREGRKGREGNYSKSQAREGNAKGGI